MTYAVVDSVIDMWAELHSLKMLRHFGGVERRFCYISGLVDEAFQISIEAPEDRTISVHAWSVETGDEEDLHQEWIVPIAGLQPTLEAAFDKVNQWKVRDTGSR
jgi:hypothetical protein